MKALQHSQRNSIQKQHSDYRWIVKRITFHLMLFIAVTQYSCTKPDSTPADSTFREWFINSSDNHLESLARIRESVLDSIVNSTRICGTVLSTKGSVHLVDSTGTEYISGFQTPANIHPDSLYPLVIYLHGGTGTQLNTKGERAYEMLSPLTDSMPLFLASPSASRTAPWWSSAGVSRILQTLRYMTYTYPIDPSRIILAGVSDGATGCYAVANSYPQPFAGFITVSGFGGLLANFGIRLNHNNIRQRPFYNVNATGDHLYPIESVNLFLDDLERNGVTITRKVYTDEKHGFDYRDKEIRVLLSLINSWRRPEYTGNTWQFVPGFPNSPAHCIDWTFQENIQNASIAMYPNGDTMIITTQGIRQAVIHLPEHYRNKPVKINSTRVITSSGNSNQQQFKLQYMKYNCIPRSVAGFFITIQK